MLNARRAGLQPELNEFFDQALQAGLTAPPTTSALCQAPLPLRIVRHVLPKGTTLALVTNVMDAPIPPDGFAALYRGRWHIKECFKRIKTRLQVENWSGVLPHTVEQAFTARSCVQTAPRP